MIRTDLPRGALAEAHRWLGLALVLPVLAIILLERFDGLYGQDPFAYFYYSTGELRESILELRRPPPFFWPPGYPILVALVSLVVGPVPLAGQIVSLLAGGIVVAFTVLLARELWPVAAGADRLLDHFVPLFAGVLVALNGQLWQSSAVVMADTTGLAFATAGVWALARYRRTRAAGWIIAASALISAATLTRWIYGVVAIPITLYALGAMTKSGRRIAIGHALGAAVCVLLFFAPVLLPAIRGALQGSTGLAPFAGNFQVYSWNPLRIFGSEFSTVDGRLVHDLPNGLYYALAPGRWAYFTPLLAPLILVGIWSTRRWLSPATLLLLWGWPAAVFAFHAGAPYQNFRFTLAFLPPLAILAAAGLEHVRLLFGPRRDRLLAGYLAVGLGLMVVAAAHTTRTLILRKNDSVATANWVRATVPPDAGVLAFGMTLTLRHYTDLPVRDLFEITEPEIAALRSSHRPAYLFADTANLAAQWSDRSPGRAFRQLLADPGLDPVSARGGFTLFRVRTGPAPIPHLQTGG